VLRARFLIRHSCNFIETVVTSKTEIFYIYFSVDTKKARIFGENVGFWCTCWSLARTSTCKSII